MKFYEAVFFEKRDNFSELLFFDIETVELDEITALKELQHRSVDQLTDDDVEKLVSAVNVKNAKYFVAAVHERYEKQASRIFELYKCKSLKIDEYIYFYNEVAMNYEKISECLLAVATASKVKGLCAFNGYGFDFVMLARYIQKRQDEALKIVFTKSTATIYAYSQQLMLVDLRKLLSSLKANSLQEAAALFGLAGKDYSDFFSYRLQDVKIMVDIAKKLDESVFTIADKQVKICYTTTRTAISALAPHRVQTFIHDYIDEIELVGGRCEIFKHKVNKAYVYDANSLYPTVMSRFLYPAREARTHKMTDEQIASFLRKRELLYIALQNNEDISMLFEATVMILPIFRVKIKGVHRLFSDYADILMRYFPFSFSSNGERVYRYDSNVVYTVTFYESLYLLFFDFDIIDAYYVEASEFFAKKEIDDLLVLRQQYKQANDDKQYLVKLISNSVYGVLALKPFLKQHLQQQAQKNKQLQLFQQVQQQQSQQYRFSFSSAPLHAIATTSTGRFAMYQVILKLLVSGFEVYYTDTDSIFTNCPPEQFSQLTSNKLSFKYEGEIQNACFVLPKLYYYTDESSVKIKAKGIGNTLERLFVLQSIKEDVKAIVRSVDMMSVPKKIPNEQWESVWNDQKLQLKDTKLVELLDIAK